MEYSITLLQISRKIINIVKKESMYRQFKSPLLNEFSASVDDWIVQINKTTKKAKNAVAPYIVPEDVAREIYHARIGEVMYDFNITLSPDLLTAFEGEGFSWVEGNTFEEKLLGWLSHYQTTLFLDGEKVIFCRDNRCVWYRSWDFKTEQEFQEYVQICRDRQIIDWSKANFYLNPVARIVYISDMHEREPFAGYCVVPFDINKSLAEMKAIGKNFRADFPQEAIPAKNKMTIEVSLKQEGDRYVVSIE